MSIDYSDPAIPGWMFDNELQFLYNISQWMTSIVEVGSWKGKSTHALLSGCKGTVWTIDHFLGTPSSRDTIHKEATETSIKDIFLNNVGHFPNLKLLDMSSEEAVKLFNDHSIDMIFLDGDHVYEAIKKDIEIWFPKTIKVICGHDYNAGVKQAVDEAFKANNIITNAVMGTIWAYWLANP